MSHIVIDLDGDDDDYNQNDKVETTTTTTSTSSSTSNSNRNRNINTYTNTPVTRGSSQAKTKHQQRSELLANIHERRLTSLSNDQSTTSSSKSSQPSNKPTTTTTTTTTTSNTSTNTNINNTNKRTNVNNENNINNKNVNKSNSNSNSNKTNETTVGSTTPSIRTNEASRVPLSVSNDLRSQLSNIRKRKHESFRSEQLSTKSFYTIDDVNKKVSDEKENRMHFASLGSSGGSDKPRSSVHTINNTFKDPETIGRKALELSNQFRQKNNKPPLRWHQDLYKIGVVHSKNMADGKVAFGHDGFDDRTRQFPFPHSKAGENVAMNNMDSTVAEVAVEGWINSKGHRENLLGHFNTCAIGVYQSHDVNIIFVWASSTSSFVNFYKKFVERSN
ncbi:hypothetical protein PPL_08696 [Heterostelium album PN500]|uniref:SCP domain-containing protein n=1 Tax=Heterostelium pallidum (strain ATCC 26659 / Pp 5 / PN500) TaxID=670386 RepID=D3BJH0_HETP5|nr:hypothetical protein PPL_08696 [Heterostelium album PN500]EFA78050.1 hypothetical protein PPL_08696 [Heterostelium album PN500]|eukprot:XP_020430177.1 hypothetical protein PPL_08696 [Heterostelium album PN500]